MNSKSSYLLKWKIFLIFTVLLLTAVTVFYAPTIFQEGNPLPVVTAIFTVEFTSSEIAPISDLKLLQKAGPPDPLSKLLSAKGWQFEEQLGSMYVYSRSGQRLFVMSRMLTTRYIVFELERSWSN